MDTAIFMRDTSLMVPSTSLCPDLRKASLSPQNWHTTVHTTFRFKALTSRLRGCFVPDQDCYRRPIDHQDQHKLPQDPTRIGYYAMHPNFEWVDICYELVFEGQSVILMVELTPAGEPTGSAFLMAKPDWTPDTKFGAGNVPPYHRRTRWDLIPQLALESVFGSHALGLARRYFYGAIRTDFRLPGFDVTGANLIPVREFDDDWDPKRSPIRYRNMESRRRVQVTSGWSGRTRRTNRMHGPVGQPRLGFSAKQFWARYCGGGYQIPHGELDLITIGTGLVYRKGQTPKLRKERGWMRGIRLLTV